MATGAHKKSIYGVHPGVSIMQNWIATLKEKSGRALEEWIALIRTEGPTDNKSRRAWLKSKHKLGTNSASWLADRAEGRALEFENPSIYLEAAGRYVDEMFSGGKAGLQPVYDKLLELGLKTGHEAKACPGRTMVPLYRRHVFANLKPTTRARVDLGLALKGCKTEIPRRLIDTGGLKKNDRITHRIPVSALSEIDGEVKRWLKIAYDLDA